MNEVNKTAAALGFFDGLHNGHKAVLRQTLQIAGEYGLVPVIFTFVNGKICNNLLMTPRQKSEALTDFGFRTVFAPDFDEIKNLSPEEFVRDILKQQMQTGMAVCGQDFKFGYNRAANTEKLAGICAEYGIGTKVVEPIFCKRDGQVEKISSSAIREKIRNGEIAKAREMGFTPEYTLEVLHGRKIAGTLNAPTINQKIPAGLVIPKYGVYKSETLINGTFRRSVTNIGVKPTLNEKPELLAETHILGTDEDLYGKIIKVRLIEFIREERKFAGLHELKTQIAKDIKSAGK
jgi:riboflavin kinase/FMN adenylyltransferase